MSQNIERVVRGGRRISSVVFIFNSCCFLWLAPLQLIEIAPDHRLSTFVLTNPALFSSTLARRFCHFLRSYHLSCIFPSNDFLHVFCYGDATQEILLLSCVLAFRAQDQLTAIDFRRDNPSSQDALDAMFLT